MSPRLFLVAFLLLLTVAFVSTMTVSAAAAAAPPMTDAVVTSTPDALGLSLLRELRDQKAHYQLPTMGADVSLDAYMPPTYPLGFPVATIRELNHMTNRELRQFIAERGGRCDGCVEKIHLLERAIALRGVPTKNEEVVSQLTPFATNAPLLPLDLLRPLSKDEMRAAHHNALSNAVLRDPRFVCEIVSRNDEASEGYGGLETTIDDSFDEIGAMRKSNVHRPPEISCRPRTLEDEVDMK